MKDGASSATDQSGTPVDNAIPPRKTSLPGGDGGNALHDSTQSSSVEKHDGSYSEDRSQFTRFSSRRSLPWYQNRELHIVFAITLLALVVRLWAIGYPTSVV